jgi:NADPH-dependent 2,4-dienoyl-CoA reductase/sulfur reductase-like enzyme
VSALTRRRFVTATASAALLCGTPAIAKSQPRVVVVGGGFGGVSAARWLRRIDPHLHVTLVTSEARFVTCPGSNAVIAGMREIDQLTFSYERVRRSGVHVIHDTATNIDPVRHRVELARGRPLEYNRVILAPGIQLNWNAIKGYDAAAAERMPHAWIAGEQTLLLRRQLQAMPDGGLVVIAVPADPYRCPPGPYERASLIAHYLKTNKPRSKLLILDAKDQFSKQALFQEAWKQLYPGMIEWVPGSQAGRVIEVNAADNRVITEFDEHAAQVANIIPPQRAGQLALSLGLDEGKGFCAVDPRTFESRVQTGIHLVGDAIIAGGMPKSGFSANSQAKVCAHAVAALVREQTPADPVLLNTCYSLVAPDYGISIAGVYRPGAQGITAVPGSGGVSPLGAAASFRALEAGYAESWYANITTEMFG